MFVDMQGFEGLVQVTLKFFVDSEFNWVVAHRKDLLVSNSWLCQYKSNDHTQYLFSYFFQHKTNWCFKKIKKTVFDMFQLSHLLFSHLVGNSAGLGHRETMC